MIPDESGPDYTPGDWKGDKVKYDTSSLMNMGETLQKDTFSNFQVGNMNAMMALRMGSGEEAGRRPIGNHGTLWETEAIANYAQGAVEKAQTMSTDIFYSLQAFANGAMNMAADAGTTDGFAAVRTAGSVEDIFNVGDGKGTLAGQRAESEAQAEAARTAALLEQQRLHRLMIRMGEDPNALPSDSAYHTDNTEGVDIRESDDENKGDGNEYFQVGPEGDWTDNGVSNTPYMPGPPPTPDDDTVTLAPGADFGSGGTSSSGTVA